MRAWVCVLLVLAACEDSSRAPRRRRAGEREQEAMAKVEALARRADDLQVKLGRCVGAPDCLPDTAILDNNGVAHTRDDLDGHVVVLNFWATWSTASTELASTLSRLATSYGSRDVIVIGLSTDGDRYSATDQALMLGLTYPVAMASSTLSYADIPSDIPTTWIYDRTGRRVETHVGAWSEYELTATLDRVLGAP